MLELSCHQLEHLKVSPHIAVLLNLYEEHLDHYGTMEKYVRAKQNIYAWQTEDDILFCNVDVMPGRVIAGAGEASACVPCRSEIISAVLVPEGQKATGAGGTSRWPDRRSATGAAAFGSRRRASPFSGTTTILISASCTASARNSP